MKHPRLPFTEDQMEEEGTVATVWGTSCPNYDAPEDEVPEVARL